MLSVDHDDYIIAGNSRGYMVELGVLVAGIRRALLESCGMKEETAEVLIHGAVDAGIQADRMRQEQEKQEGTS